MSYKPTLAGRLRPMLECYGEYALSPDEEAALAEVAALEQRVAALEQDRDDIRGAIPECCPNRTRCTDCGRRMVWSRAGNAASWMCPGCVYDRMRKAERQLSASTAADEALVARIDAWLDWRERGYRGPPPDESVYVLLRDCRASLDPHPDYNSEVKT